jgi:hypothetical protein
MTLIRLLHRLKLELTRLSAEKKSAAAGVAHPGPAKAAVASVPIREGF